MTTDITFRPGLPGLMAALSVAEKLTANSPNLPSSVTVDDDFDWVEIDGKVERPMGVILYFHRAPESVRSFAELAGASVTEEPHNGTQGNTLTSATGVRDGVPFRAWALTRAEDQAVTA